MCDIYTLLELKLYNRKPTRSRATCLSLHAVVCMTFGALAIEDAVHRYDFRSMGENYSNVPSIVSRSLTNVTKVDSAANGL